MKKNLKLMTAALAMTALASCTDDLTVNGSQKGLYGKDDLVATLQFNETRTRFAVQEESDKVKGGNKQLVWSDNDQIRVFTLDKLSQDLYEIKTGAGTGDAVFQRIADSGLTGEKYAITEATSIYGISATNVDGQDLPLLTVTLPGEYTVGEDAAGNKNFPVPYWGKATVTGTDEDTYINASFTGLAAFLRVSAKELPAGTRAIVLTTHGDRTGNNPKEGFQLGATMPTEDSQDNTSGWGDYTKFPVTTGGKSEAISGTLNCVLDPSKDRNDVFLKVDDRLVKSDTLRVNLTDDEDQIFYIPIVVGTYENLHVLAVTGDSKYSYTWVGTELKNFKNETFENNHAYYLDMNLKNFAIADFNTLNKFIAQKNGTAGLTTVINVEEFTGATDDGETDDTDYATDKLDITGEGNVVINFMSMTGGAAITIEEGETAIAASETPTAEYNFDPAFAQDVTINSPLRKVVLGTVGGVNSTTFDITVSGPADKYVMGYDIYDNVEKYKYAVQNESALTIKNGFKKVTVDDATKGDIFVYTDGEETELLELDVLSSYNNDLRISSALVKVIKMEDVADGVRKVYTDGSSAIQTIQDQTAAGYPLNTEIESYYTGAGLSDYAWQNGYDQEEILTVAQLQSMGAKERTIGGTTVATAKTDGKYKIPNDIVGHFWLGSKDYMWVGPEVTMDDYELDGENSSLRNMYIDADGSSNTIYIDDPHYCCTSCGLPGTETTLTITDDLGLIRSIKNTATAKVTRVNLNDAYIVTENEIDNIGAIVGDVEITGDFTFTDNALGEVKIDVNGDNVGGMIGNLSAAKLTITGNNSTNSKNDGGYVISDKGYVGGLIGNAVATDAVSLSNNTVVMQNNVEAGEGYAAGLVGSLEGSAAINANKNKVDVAEITAEEKYAAGLIGYMEGGAAAILDGSNVKAQTVSTGDKYAGGLIGQALVPAANGIYLRNSTVAITTELAAEEGEVGGLVGNALKAKKLVVNNNTATDQNTTVTVAKLSGAYAAGGILGSNSTAAPLTVYTGHKTGTGAWTNQVNVTVTAYNNTKDATYFVGGDRYKYGTMQDVIGYKQSAVTIFNDKLTVSGNLNDAAKKAVFYDAHVDDVHTTTAGEFYWGDTKGYVGFGYTGQYTLSSEADYTGGSPVLPEQENGYDYFKAY